MKGLRGPPFGIHKHSHAKHGGDAHGPRQTFGHVVKVKVRVFVLAKFLGKARASISAHNKQKFEFETTEEKL